jgi:thiol-disulfide isomerase/thioredoxin
MTKSLTARILFGSLLLSLTSAVSSPAADTPAGPTDPKAQKTFAEAQKKLSDRPTRLAKEEALELLKKADKQDGHHCVACEKQIISMAIQGGDFKLAIEAGTDLLSNAKTPYEMATARAYRGIAELKQGQIDHKQSQYAAADQDFQAALKVSPNSSAVLFSEGMALANLQQDDAARASFQAYLKLTKADSVEGRRAARYVMEPQLARQRMAPAFEITTIDGKQVSLDDLQGKVVLMDFWATWCGPCREALPNIQHIAQKFAGQPLVVLSISLDSDDGAWKKFVADHKMTWMQARDGGFTGPLSRQFNVNAIPHTFTIDADGVLQDEHIGDAAIEGKLKKLIAQAQQMPPPTPATEEAKLPSQ